MTQPAPCGGALEQLDLHDDPGVPPPGWRKRLFAAFMAACSPKASHRFHSWKERLFAGLSREQGVHTVLEVGMGTAPNLKYYAGRVDSIVGVDFNAAMHPHALASAVAAGVTGSKLQLVVGRAEALPLPDASVDAVVATHLMCSVQEVPRALAEFQRVLRPGGRYLFLEHVAAPSQTRLHSWQDWLTPVCSTVADGCHLNRDTLARIEAAGFSKVEAERFEPDLPWLARIFAPHVAGVAIK